MFGTQAGDIALRKLRSRGIQLQLIEKQARNGREERI